MEFQNDALSSPKPTYRECLKNQALSLGGYAVDGCRDFLPTGASGTLDAFICAACNCHRNFHRKESFDPIHEPLPIAYRTPTGQYLAGNLGDEIGREDVANYDGNGNERSSSRARKKRFRTKFTAEQKEKMVALAEKMRWKMERHDEEAVHQLCHETGIPRHVFKIWMHNNKHTIGRKS